MIEVKNTLNGKLNASIVKEYPELEEITITPALEGQELKPNKYGYSKITIEAIPATDLTIEPKTEEQITSGIFKNVTVEAIKSNILNLKPSEEQQTAEGVFTQVNINPIQVEEITTDLDFSNSDSIEITAQEGAYIKKTTINKPTNLNPENIKSGETVCGIAGTNADTSDADATSDDIVAGKTAYVANEKIQGTYKPLDTSDATATAEDIAKDKTAYVNGEKIVGAMPVVDYNAKIDTVGVTGTINMPVLLKILDFTNVNLSSITTLKSFFSGCGNVEELINFAPTNTTNEDYTYTNCSKLKNIPDYNRSKVTSMINSYWNCSSLKEVKGLNVPANKVFQATFYQCTGLETLEITSTNSAIKFEKLCYGCTSLKAVSLPYQNVATSMYDMFNGCTALETITSINTSYLQNGGHQSIFSGCNSLTDESLNIILAMCRNATKITQNKTLSYIGLTSDQATRCQSLSNYQAFLDARLGYRILK